MTDWEKLREVGHEVSPPPFESLMTTASKRDRRARIVTATATLSVLTVLALGLGLANDDDGPIQPAQDPSESVSTPDDESPLPDGVLPLPEPDAGEDYATLDAGRYRVPISDTLSFDVDLPQETFAHSGGAFLSSGDIILNVTSADERYGVPVDPCHAQYVEEAGTSVDELVEAIRNLPIYQVSSPEPVEVGGASGYYLQIRIPANYDATSCQDGRVGLPKPADDDTRNVKPGYVGRLWILDVAGERVVIAPFCQRCRAGAPSRIADRVDSITFTPTP